MKNTKRVLSLALAVMISASTLVGCGDKQPTEDSPKNSTSTGSATDSTEKTVTLRIMGKDKGVTLGNEKVTLTDWTKSGSKLWGKLTSDLNSIGIKLDLNLVPEDQYETVCQTQLAAGLDCDIMNISPLDVKTRLSLVEQKRILPINEIWEKYSDGSAKNFFTNGDGAFAVGLTALNDGNVYWLTDIQTSTFGDNVVGATLGFHIRKDWLDKLGLPVPATTDELYKDLMEFQNKDVNGSGQKDEVLSVDLKSFGTSIGQWFGFGPSITYVDEQDGNKVKSPWYNKNVKAYIEYMKKLVSAGLVDTSDQASQKKAENKIAGFSNWAMETWEEPQVKVKEGAAAPYYLPFLARAVDDQDPWVLLQRGNQISNRGYAVTNECKNPEAVAKLLDYMTRPEYCDLSENGIKDYTYSVDAQGNKIKIKEGNSEIKIMATVPPALWTNDSILPRFTIGKKCEDEMNQMIENGKISGYPDKGYKEKADYSEMCYKYKYTTGHDPEADYAVATKEELEKISSITTDLTTYSDELLTKLILGQKSLDSWDSYINDLKRLGLDDLIAINQARYDRAHK